MVEQIARLNRERKVVALAGRAPAKATEETAGSAARTTAEATARPAAAWTPASTTASGRSAAAEVVIIATVAASSLGNRQNQRFSRCGS